MTAVATLTFSDTRTEADDEGGALLGQLLSDAGHVVVAHAIVREDREAIVAALDAALSRHDVAAIVTTGGTGIAERDIAVDVLESRLEKRLEGFGETFRRLSFEQVGARGILSRAVAGVAGGKLVIAVPGSVKAIRLAVVELIAPILPHATDLLAGRTKHGTA